MQAQSLSEKFKALYDAWAGAIQTKHWAWFERHFAADWTGTARPWPGLHLGRAELIALDQQIESMEARWLKVEAVALGATVATIAVAHVVGENFTPGAMLQEGVATAEAFNAYCAGNTLAYAGAWRRHAEGHWEMYDHRMIGVIAGYEPTARPYAS